MLREIVEMLWEGSENPVLLSLNSHHAKRQLIRDYGGWEGVDQTFFAGVPVVVNEDQEKIAVFVEGEDGDDSNDVSIAIEDDTFYVMSDEVTISFDLDEVIGLINEWFDQEWEQI